MNCQIADERPGICQGCSSVFAVMRDDGAIKSTTQMATSSVSPPISMIAITGILPVPWAAFQISTTLPRAGLKDAGLATPGGGGSARSDVGDNRMGHHCGRDAQCPDRC